MRAEARAGRSLTQRGRVVDPAAMEHRAEDAVPVVDLGDVSGTASGIHDIPDRVVRLFDDLRRHRVTQVEMVHDDVH